MNCLKCGREIEEGQVFCNACLVQMAKYPVKPGTAVQLPSRGSAAAAKKVHARRRGKTALEEQLKALKARVRVLSVLLAACVVLLVVLSVVTLRYMSANRLLPGAELLRRHRYYAYQGKLMFHVKHFSPDISER